MVSACNGMYRGEKSIRTDLCYLFSVARIAAGDWLPIIDRDSGSITTITGVMLMPKRSASAVCRAIRSEQAVVISLSGKNPAIACCRLLTLSVEHQTRPHIFNHRVANGVGRNGQKRHRQTGIRILLNAFHYVAAVNALVINKHQQLQFFSRSLKRDGLEVCKRAGNIVERVLRGYYPWLRKYLNLSHTEWLTSFSLCLSSFTNSPDR